MPPLPPATGTLKCVIGFNIGGDVTAQTRIFIHYTGTAPTAAQLNTFATAIASNWRSQMAGTYGAGASQTSVSVVDLSSASGNVGFDGSSGAGTRAGVAVPNQVCTQMIYGIQRRYRGGHPKGFFPAGMAADIVAGNLWSAAYLSAVNTGYQAFINAVLAAIWTGAGVLTQVNVSYFTGFTVVTNPITHRARNVPTLRGTPIVEQILGFAAEDTPGTQRRRALGRA